MSVTKTETVYVYYREEHVLYKVQKQILMQCP